MEENKNNRDELLNSQKAEFPEPRPRRLFPPEMEIRKGFPPDLTNYKPSIVVKKDKVLKEATEVQDTPSDLEEES